MSANCVKGPKKSSPSNNKTCPKLTVTQSKQIAQEQLEECYKELRGSLNKTKESFVTFKTKCFFSPEPEFNKAFKESLHQIESAVDDMGNSIGSLFGLSKNTDEEVKDPQENKSVTKEDQVENVLNLSSDQSDVLAKANLNITPPASEAGNDDELVTAVEQPAPAKTSGTKRHSEESSQNATKRPRRSLIEDYLIKEKGGAVEETASEDGASTPGGESTSSGETKPSSEEVEYEVENIITFKKTGARFYYKVSWKGYGLDDCTWEPAEHLTDCSEVLLEFYKTQLKKRESTASNGDLNNQVFPYDRDFQEYIREAFMYIVQPTESEKKHVYRHSPFYKPMSKEEFNELVDKALAARKVDRYNMFKKQIQDQVLLQAVEKERTRQLAELRKWERSLNSTCSDPAKIQVENDVDLELPPFDFVYINELKEGHGVTLPNDPLLGCSCSDCSNTQTSCCASQMNSWFAYNKFGRLKVSLGTPVYECNTRCACPSTCANRVVQKGRKFNLSIFRTANGRGWGVKALEPIKKDSFVVEYVGEVITSEEAEHRGQTYDKKGCTYLFDLDFNKGDQNPYTVDAAKYGNVSHFINHSCDPNLVVFNVWVNCLDPDLPRLALFACRDIKKGEELTFDYNSGLESEQMKAEAASILAEEFSEEEENATPEKCAYSLEPNGSSGVLKTPKGNRGLKYGKTECRCGAANCRKYFF